MALGETLDDRLPLTMGQQPRVQQRERWAGADLAVGDAGTVVVVVEAKPHRGCLAGGHDSHRMERQTIHPHLGECMKLGATVTPAPLPLCEWCLLASDSSSHTAAFLLVHATSQNAAQLAGLASELVKAHHCCI